MRFVLTAKLLGSILFTLPACTNDDTYSGPFDDAGWNPTNFFVSSDTSATGNLGGLDGADARCERLARAAELSHTGWHAYLSTEGEDGAAARDRIGSGPFINSKGAKLADDVGSLHERSGDAELFLDENGEKIPGQWEGSPQPITHDILTGTGPDGQVLAGKTCANWTSDSADLAAQVGHSDGLGPGMNANPPFDSWFSSHENGGCNDTAPRGGAGHIYCFAP